MITSVFKKSTPLNFSLAIFFILVFFFIYQFQDLSWAKSYFSVLEKITVLIVLVASVLITNFIIKKNELSKDSTYTVLFYLLFLLFFPSLFDNTKLIISNFFILLAVRRLISMHSQKELKEKIFDASLWIFFAALFHFWSILFLILVFFSIISHFSGDFKNFLLPIIALFAVVTIFAMYSLLSNIDMNEFINNSIVTNFKIDYFTNNYQNAALSIYATMVLFFVTSMLFTYSGRPLILHASYQKVIFSFLIGVVIFLVSPNKSNDMLIFTIPTLAVMATNHIEIKQYKLKQEMVLFVVIVCSLFTFFSQL